MSRIGKKEISIPSGVTVALDGQAIKVKGPKGELAYTAPEEITVANENGVLSFTPRDESQRARAMWGLSRTLTNNMVEGVTKGYEEVLELVGVGYRAALKGKDLNLQLGYSHEIDMPPPEGISFAVPRPVEIRIAGIDKQMVGEVAARIRRLRPPEPYKGKGVRYQGEKFAARKARRSKRHGPFSSRNSSAPFRAQPHPPQGDVQRSAASVGAPFGQEHLRPGHRRWPGRDPRRRLLAGRRQGS